MKIAVSSTGKDLESQVSQVFGRCPYFIIIEIEDKKIVKTEAMENTSAQQFSGAGISAAQMVVQSGAKAIITGNVGPKAYSVLKQFGVEIYKGSGTVKDVIQKFIEKQLEKIQ